MRAKERRQHIFWSPAQPPDPPPPTPSSGGDDRPAVSTSERAQFRIGVGPVAVLHVLGDSGRRFNAASTPLHRRFNADFRHFRHFSPSTPLQRRFSAGSMPLQCHFNAASTAQRRGDHESKRGLEHVLPLPARKRLFSSRAIRATPYVNPLMPLGPSARSQLRDDVIQRRPGAQNV